MPSVLQDWVMCLPLREQGVLVIALRGPDGARKEHGAKNIVRSLRGSVMVTGATGKPLAPGESLPDDSFMDLFRIGHPKSEHWNDAQREFFRSWDEYNVHFLFHLIHAAEVLGYRHPVDFIAERWRHFYYRCCDKCHVYPEGFVTMKSRLKDGHKLDDPE